MVSFGECSAHVLFSFFKDKEFMVMQCSGFCVAQSVKERNLMLTDAVFIKEIVRINFVMKESFVCYFFRTYKCNSYKTARDVSLSAACKRAAISLITGYVNYFILMLFFLSQSVSSQRFIPLIKG